MGKGGSNGRWARERRAGTRTSKRTLQCTGVGLHGGNSFAAPSPSSLPWERTNELGPKNWRRRVFFQAVSLFFSLLGKLAFVRPTDLSLFAPNAPPTLCSEAEARLCRYNSAIMLAASSLFPFSCMCVCMSVQREADPPHHHLPLPLSSFPHLFPGLFMPPPPPPPPHALSPPYALVGPESQPLSWSSA